MRAFFSKLLQVLGALACLSALACGLDLVPAGACGLGWAAALLTGGLFLLALGTWLRGEPHS
jgi:hypothetical protein